MHAHTCIHMHMHTGTFFHICSTLHIYIHKKNTYIHAYKHSYIQIYTYIQNIHVQYYLMYTHIHYYLWLQVVKVNFKGLL